MDKADKINSKRGKKLASSSKEVYKGYLEVKITSRKDKGKVKKIERVSTEPIVDTPKKVKYIDYLKDRRRAETTLESQLEEVYTSSELNLHKAASLIEKIEQRRRLRFKNMNDRDFGQVENKIKLLNHIYNQ